MQNRWMRLACALLAAALAMSAAGALAETWTCPDCGQTGNTGNFCPNWAAAKPAEGWT